MNEFLNRDWTSSELARLYQARLNFIPYSIIAGQIGRSAEECEKKWRDGSNWQKRMGFENDVQAASVEQAKEDIYNKLSDKEDGRLSVARLRADIWGDKIAQSIKPFNEIPQPKSWKPSFADGHEEDEEEVGLLLSDLHIGLKFTMEETGGLGEYSLSKFLQRMDNLRLSVRDIFARHSKLYRLPVLNIFCLGDVTHGMTNVGKWSAAYMDLSITDQVAAGVHAISESLAYFLSMFNEIRFYGVIGNHGRAAPKGIEKDHVNWDYHCYQMLMSRLNKNPRIQFYCPKTWWVAPTIKNHKFLALHGDDVNGKGSPITALSGVEAKIAGLMKGFPDYTMIGHFHSASEFTTNHGELFINGSFTGPDIFSLKSLQAGGKPTQKLFGIHEKYGVSWRYNLDLDAPRRPD